MDATHNKCPYRTLSARSRYRFERLRQDPVAFALVERLARRRRVSLRDLLQQSRGTDATALARQLAMYLVHVLLSRPQDTVGRLFDRNPTTVSHACKVVEWLRERDPAIEAELAAIEAEGWGKCPPAADSRLTVAATGPHAEAGHAP
ncbi:MAG: helix-turn-helix domain-containing protein [Devosia sp.]